MSDVELWNVYILLCQDTSLYTGIAKDVLARFQAHKEGRGAKYTRSRPPVAIVYQEALPSRSAALKRESEIKKWSRAQKVSKLGLTIDQNK